MQTKVYFASSVPAALEIARRELGEDAMLVESRPAPPEARQYGRLEVTFAWNPREPGRLVQFIDKDELAGKGGLRKQPASQMDEIRQQLAALRVAIGGHTSAEAEAEGSWIAGRLIENGFSRELAAEIAAAAATGDAAAAVVGELTRRIPASGPMEARTIAFIGPPGRGKTVSLVKMAMKSGLSRHIPVRIYTAGAHGVGAKEQMARFAGILGTPWQACESLPSLGLALNGDPWKGLVLIDTPGMAPAEASELGDLGRFFAARPEIEKHLVLRADATSADMLGVISRFSGLAPTRLLFTGLDEASSVAPMVETLIRSGIPAEFAGTGQQIPEDLAEVSPERLARSAWAGDPASSTIDRARFALAAA